MENYMNDYLTIALPKGKLFTISKNLLHRVGLSADHLSEKSRKLVIENEDLKVRFIIAKTSDVPTYVEYGADGCSPKGKASTFARLLLYKSRNQIPSYCRKFFCKAGDADGVHQVKRLH